MKNDQNYLHRPIVISIPAALKILIIADYILAGTIFAYASDNYERRPVVIIAFLLEITASISCALSINIIQYLISRLLVGTATIGRLITFGSLCKNI